VRRAQAYTVSYSDPDTDARAYHAGANDNHAGIESQHPCSSGRVHPRLD
jgi:hypothetical protein